jgi:uncharacterized repeat protein (TIGR03803 family)
MTKRTACIVLLLCVAAVSASAQTFTTLASFDGTNGSFPQAQLVQGFDGNLYGTTFEGGVGNDEVCDSGCGTVFSINSGGTLNTLYSFCPEFGCTENDPETGLTQSTDGNLYGTAGGIFEITPEGALTTIWTPCGYSCGYSPGQLVQANDDSFYGLDSLNPYGAGSAFTITPEGLFTMINSSLSYPEAPLAQGADGNFYGVTFAGGNASCDTGCGTLFKLTPEGDLTTLYSFTGNSDGAAPNAPLVVSADGNLYGTTRCCPFYTGGTVFKLTPAGQLTTLYTFCSQSHCADGAYPLVGLTQATDGNLYGTTFQGGFNSAGGGGTIFRITPAGAFKTLHKFGGPDGDGPYAALVQATDGSLYGTANKGGTDNLGTVFSLSIDLEQFVETLPTSRTIGGHVIILGNNLTGSTAVSFNGIAAPFTVVSDTEITTSVPSGTTTGFVAVTTASGTLKSNKPFQIIP